MNERASESASREGQNEGASLRSDVRSYETLVPSLRRITDWSDNGLGNIFNRFCRIVRLYSATLNQAADVLCSPHSDASAQMIDRFRETTGLDASPPGTSADWDQRFDRRFGILIAENLIQTQ